MKFPQTFIEELKSRLSLSEVVGKSVLLKKHGREYQALCPFHQEKSPSFTVNDEKGFYHCFGCGAHGDQIGFVMQYERLSYPEAVEKLANQAGLSMPVLSREAIEKEEKQQSLYQVMQACADWFASQLSSASEAVIARDYLQSRGLKAETIRQFQLGYAPENRHALVDAMAKQGITQAQLIETGMLIVIEQQAPYSRYRRRLMFPILDAKGRVIAFGGRILPGENSTKAAKYVNSPETPLFHKGNQLFNLKQAKIAAARAGQLIIAEGYMDVIALAQAGITHAVAPLGTAITEAQLLQCWKMVDVPVLCLDSDAAGIRAMQRAIDLALPMLQPGKSLLIAQLPKGEDPDSMIRHFGKQAFESAIAQARPLVEMLWQAAMDVDAKTPEAKAAQEKALFKRIEAIKDATVHQYYRQEMQQKLRQAQQYSYRARPFFGGKREQAAAKQPLPTMPLLPGDVEEGVGEVVGKLLALVAWFPKLLKDSDIENDWMGLPLVQPWQVALHAALLAQLPDMEADEAAYVSEDAILLQLDSATIRQLQKNIDKLGVPKQADATMRGLIALRLWPELMNSLQCARLKADIKAAENALASALTDAHFSRLSALKHQLEELERERSAYYQDDPLGGVG